MELKTIHIETVKRLVCSGCIPFDAFVESVHYLLFLENTSFKYINKKLGIHLDCLMEMSRPKLEKLPKAGQQFLRMYSDYMILRLFYEFKIKPKLVVSYLDLTTKNKGGLR